MDNVYTSTTTGQMKAPDDWDHSEVQVHPLYISAGNVGKHQCFASYWKPSVEDLEILNAGGAVEVMLLGVQPAMQVNAQAIPEVDPASIVTDVSEKSQ